MSAWGLLLAAGQSKRFSIENKLLASIDGQPLVCRSLALLQQRYGERVLVVLGHEAERLRPLLHQCLLVVNPEYGKGMGHSLAFGISQLPADCRSVLVMLADQYALNSEDLQQLQNAYDREATLVCSQYQDHKGVPAVFPRAAFPALCQLQGDQGARGLLLDARALPLANAALDIDTPADLPPGSSIGTL